MKLTNSRHVLPALAESEADLAGALPIAREHRAGLAPQIENIVQQHESNRDGNDDEVEELHELEHAPARSGPRHCVHRPDGKAAARVVVALAAGLAQVGVIDGGARIAGWIDVVHAMAAGAVGDGLAASARGEPVVAVLVGGDAVPGHREAGHQRRIGMAARAGFLRDVRHINRRSGIAGREDAVLAVAVGAGGRLQNAFGDGLAVNALRVGVVDVRVALAAGGGDVLLPDFRMRIGDGQDVVHAVAVIARSGVFVALLDGAAMHALPICLDGANFGEHVLRGQLWIGVARAAGIGQMLLAHRRFADRRMARQRARSRGNSGMWAHRRCRDRARGRECWRGTARLRLRGR